MQELKCNGCTDCCDHTIINPELIAARSELFISIEIFNKYAVKVRCRMVEKGVGCKIHPSITGLPDIRPPFCQEFDNRRCGKASY